MSDIGIGEYVSRKEYLKKYNSNVGYALYIQNNIKRNDYARLNTGEIVKVIGIKENNINKKAIYYGFYEQDWFDSSAVENFSNNIIDLIEVGDYVNGYKVINVINKEPCPSGKCIDIDSNKNSRELKKYYHTRFKKIFGLDYKDKTAEITFRNGYRVDSPGLKCKCKLKIGQGKPEWGAELNKEYYILEILEIVGGEDESTR